MRWMPTADTLAAERVACHARKMPSTHTASTAAPDPLTPRTLLLLALLWLAGLGAAAQFAKIGTVFAQMRALYPTHGAEIGFLLSAISVVGIVCGLFAGLLIASYGFRTLLLPALILGAALSFVQALLPDFGLMLATRGVEGLSHLIIVVAAPTLMAQISPAKWRPLVMSVWSTFFGVAFAVTALVGVPLVETNGIPALFLAHGFVLMASAASLWLMLPMRLIARDETAPKISVSWLWREHIAAYSSPAIAAPAFGWLLYTLTYVAVLTVLPDWLDEETRSWAIAAMPIAGLVSALLTGIVILPHLSAVNTVILGFGLSAVAAVTFPFVEARATLGVILFACLGLVQAASFAAVPELLDSAEDQARANGAMAQMGNLGNSIGTPLLLLAMLSLGLRGFALFAVVAYTIGIALHLWCANRRVTI